MIYYRFMKWLYSVISVLFIGVIFAIGFYYTKEEALKSKLSLIPTLEPSISISVTPSITIIPSTEPTIVRSYQSSPTTSPTTYQNYGWYQHNGQSEQYVNGN